MTWTRLVPTSVAAALIAVAAVVLATPRTATAGDTVEACGNEDGKLCKDKCTSWCGTQTCCETTYYYYPKNVE